MEPSSPKITSRSALALAHYQAMGAERLRRKLVTHALNLGRYWALKPHQIRDSASLAVGDLFAHPMWPDPTEPAPWMHWNRHTDEDVRQLVREALTLGVPRSKARLIEHLRSGGLVCSNDRLWKMVGEVLRE
jgi:hypothetical protein